MSLGVSELDDTKPSSRGLPFPAHTVVRQELDTGFFQCLLNRDARKIMGRTQAALEIPDRFYGHADLIGQFPLRPIKQGPGGAALSR